jgi:hypothetical protein
MGSRGAFLAGEQGSILSRGDIIFLYSLTNTSRLRIKSVKRMLLPEIVKRQCS